MELERCINQSQHKFINAQQLQLNIIPFTPLQSSKVFAFYDEKVPNSFSIKGYKLFTEFPEGREEDKQFFYSTFQPKNEQTFEEDIEFTKTINFSRHYFSHPIFNYFKSIEGAIVFPNYVDDVEVWIIDIKHKNNTYNHYNKYTLKVPYNAVVQKSFELMLAYNGTSKVLKQSMAALENYDTQKYNFINCNRTIYKYDNIPEDLKQDQTTLFPVLGNELKKDFDIYEEVKKENRYPVLLQNSECLLQAICIHTSTCRVVELRTRLLCNTRQESLYNKIRF